MTLQDVLAAAIRDPHVAQRLLPALMSDLVAPNPFHRQIARFANEFLDEHNSLPQEGDWTAWIDGLGERQSDGVRETLRNLRGRDLSGYTPEYVADHAAATLQQEAAYTAISRLNRMEGDGLAKALGELTQEVQKTALVANPSATSWPDPVPLAAPAPDPLPVDALPEWVRDHVESVADHVQVPTDLPLMLALSALSTAAANKARITIRPGHREPVHLWTVTVLPPGARKSPVFKKMISPLYEYEDQRREEVRPERDRAEDRKDVIEGLLKDAKKTAKDAESEGGVEQAFEKMEHLRDQLEEVEVPSVPRLIVSDVTSEKLAALMSENGGRIAVLSPEGDILKILAGRYRSGQVDFDHYKRGWTGDEPIRDDRMGRDGSHVRRPALTAGLTVQPAVLETLQNKEVFRGEGLLGRFLYALPDARIGHRRTGADVPPLDGAARGRYNSHLTSLLHAGPADVDEKGEYEPHALELSPEAREAYFAFEGEVEEELAAGKHLARIADWGTKLPGQVARVAGLLTLAARSGDAKPLWASSVPKRWMEAAIRIGRGLIPHARQALLDLVEVDPDLRLARHVHERLQEIAPYERITVSDLHERIRGKKGLRQVDALKRVLRRLEEHGFVRIVERPSTGGRPPSPWVLHNPKDGGRYPKKSQKVGGGQTSSDKSDQSGASPDPDTDE